MQAGRQAGGWLAGWLGCRQKIFNYKKITSLWACFASYTGAYELSFAMLSIANGGVLMHSKIMEQGGEIARMLVPLS